MKEWQPKEHGAVYFISDKSRVLIRVADWLEDRLEH